MESGGRFNTQKVEYPRDFDWPYNGEQPLFRTGFEFTPLESIYDFKLDSFPMPFHFNCLPRFEFQDFSDFSGGNFFSPEIDVQSMYNDISFEEKPLETAMGSFHEHCEDVNEGLREVSGTERRGFSKTMKSYGNGGRKSGSLKLEEIQKQFHLPITTAAKKLKVGVTLLKKRCRELHIMRWPHRKLKSLNSLMNNVKEMGLTREMVMLEEHKKMVEEEPDMQLSERTKRLRQASFKAKYKQRRTLTHPDCLFQFPCHQV